MSPPCGSFCGLYKVVGIQARPAVSKSEAKITMLQVCSFLFSFSFFPLNGKGTLFFFSFRFPSRGNLSQTFHRDPPLGRHQTWMFSTREQNIWDFQAFKEEIWGNSSRSGPLLDFPCLWGARQRTLLCFSP